MRSRSCTAPSNGGHRQTDRSHPTAIAHAAAAAAAVDDAVVVARLLPLIPLPYHYHYYQNKKPKRQLHEGTAPPLVLVLLGTPAAASAARPLIHYLPHNVLKQRRHTRPAES